MFAGRADCEYPMFAATPCGVTIPYLRHAMARGEVARPGCSGCRSARSAAGLLSIRQHWRPEWALSIWLNVLPEHLWRDSGDAVRIANYTESTFWHVLPPQPMFPVLPAMRRAGIGFWPSMVTGCDPGPIPVRSHGKRIKTESWRLRFRSERTWPTDLALLGAMRRERNNLGSNVSTLPEVYRDNDPGYSLFCKETAIKAAKAPSPPFHVTDHAEAAHWAAPASLRRAGLRAQRPQRNAKCLMPTS